MRDDKGQSGSLADYQADYAAGAAWCAQHGHNPSTATAYDPPQTFCRNCGRWADSQGHFTIFLGPHMRGIPTRNRGTDGTD